MSAAPLRILAVDDSPDMADSTARVLRLMGHETRIALDGPAAPTIAPAYLPEVVRRVSEGPNGLAGSTLHAGRPG